MSSTEHDTLRIGVGAGFSGDRIEPAVALAEHGQLDVLVFECLAERTIAIAVRERLRDADAGYDPLLEDRMMAVLPACVRNGVKIISNMGAANPIAAARATARIAVKLGLPNLKIAAVVGDEVTSRFGGSDLISANAYVGCEPIIEALAAGADVVLTGRVADPSLFLAPMAHRFGWAMDDWERLGAGTVIGHLLECAGQLTGGYHADPGFKDVEGLVDLGFPIAEVAHDGSATLAKLPSAGGRITMATCKEQLLYEVQDPRAYLTPDVTADFSAVRFEQIDPDRIAVSGGTGRPRPDRLKVSVGRDEGFIGEGQISYAGPGCVARARLAGKIVQARLQRMGDVFSEIRHDLIGLDAVFVGVAPAIEPNEVRLRVAARALSAASARIVGREVDGLYTNGPAGGGGVSQSVRPVVGVTPAFIERDAVRPAIVWEIAE